MDAAEHLRQLRESLAANPRRALASALGVFWGTAAIVVLLAFGTGFQAFMREEFARFGRGVVLVYPASTSSGFPGYREGVPVRISAAQAARAERETREWVSAILPQHIAPGRVLVEASGVARRLDLSGSDERFARYRNFEIAYGRFFDRDDVRGARAVAVLGYEAASDLFGAPERGVGARIRIEGRSFELIGVAARKGRQYMNTNRPDNRLLIVPYTAAERRLGLPEEALANLLVFPRPGVSGERAVRAVLASLGPLAGFHPDDADAVKWFDSASILGLVDLFASGFAWFIGIAGTLTLLIGGVGIANYHLAVLAERTLEIAVAKAIGARNRTLVLQAALEALAVAGGSALAGLLLGIAACALLAAIAPADRFPRPILSGAALSVTLAATCGVGVVAALVPALRVRRLEVSAALRSG
jgi:putative ABC transport system permease protein